ncbi:hypothetical protein PIB30_082017 [Stylosanthes scabra]|uniref:WAT1-related protein n=1 Tax=Stylosanthes scabra TaxID=79078 RepID=A0ABU6VQD6_9FABA|nr:hypothetical protein [Stylosanthes scabra]
MAKILGTIASVGGATVITLYKGPPLLHLQTPQRQQDSHMHQSSTKVQNWTWGCIYLFGHCLSWAAWMVFQAPVVKKYPAKLSLTSFTFFFGLIQFLIIAAFLETDMERWKIISTQELLTILYAGIVSSGVVISLQTWCIQKGGPVCVAVFQDYRGNCDNGWALLSPMGEEQTEECEYRGKGITNASFAQR